MKKGADKMSKEIIIFDTTLRDGEQSPGASMSLEQKLKLAIELERLGVDIIEAGFPVSSPVQFEAVSEISKAVSNVKIAALARCTKKDIDAAYESLKDAKNKVLHIFIATSPLHRKYKLRKSKEEILETIQEHIEYSKKYFDEIEFSAEDASRTEPEFLYEVIKLTANLGVKTFNIPDTVGYAIPNEFGNLIKSVYDNVPEAKNINISVHCHNDLGLAVANSIAAIQNGANQVEVTLNGIGERAGNCALEELVMAINVRKDLLDFQTGIKTEFLYPTSKLLQNITGLLIPRNKPIFGDNVFAHESGIHQDGVLKYKETYEIMKPETIGRKIENIVLGRHSGKHALRKKLEQYGLQLTEEEFEEAFKQFTIIADKKKEVFDEDLLQIISNILGKVEKGYKLKYFHVFSGNSILPTASIKLVGKDEEKIATAVGDGPVDAIYNAIDSALNIKCKLKEYILQSVGSGKDALGQVKIILEISNKDFVGKGISTDVVEASALAYINAINNYYFNQYFNNGESNE